MAKRLATLFELRSNHFTQTMQQINQVATRGALVEYTTYSRIWEYPWLWSHLRPLCGRRLTVLDVGSEKSPLPWFLAAQGFRVMISDVRLDYWKIWERAHRTLKVAVSKRVFDALDIDLTTGSIDVYLSASVIEHIPDKKRAIAEAARVLKPGGLLLMSFDICELEMGMTFPEWNGKALSMREFDDLFRDSLWFETGLAELRWNTEDIPAYLNWNRATASHHNYVTGAAAIRRNTRVWRESPTLSVLRWISAATNPSLRRFLFALATKNPGLYQQLSIHKIARQIWSFFGKSV